LREGLVSALSMLLMGLALGMRHATDADHVVVLSTLVQREPGLWRALRLGLLWGVGHTTAFMGVGLLLLLTDVRMPGFFEPVVDVAVGVMLIGFGAWHLARPGPAPTPASPVTYARPVLVGLAHGLAGSAGIALLAATTIHSRGLAAAYLGIFGLGTIVGMGILTLVIAHPLRWTIERGGWVARVSTVTASLLSVGVGAWILIRGAL